MMFAALTVALLGTGMFVSPGHAGDAILLDFSSSHCPPCRAMQPVLAQLEQTGVPIRHVDVAAEPHLASRYGVQKTPTFVVLKDGREVARLVGMQTAAQLHAALATETRGPLVATGARATPVAPPTAPQTQLTSIGAPALEAITPPDRAATRGEAMPNASVAAAVERARAATVRLRVHDEHGYGAGTGTIIDTHGDEALVLTCGHLFRDNQGQGKIEVDLFVGGQVQTVLGQVIDYDADTRDIALVAIRPGLQVQPVPIAAAEDRVANGTVAFSFGCDRGDDPSRRDTRITGVDKYNQHLGVSNLEIEGAPIDGRSGGGLFDQQGRLIGVCNAADYDNDVGIYAGPGSVRWQLDRANLTHLYDRSQGALAGGAAGGAGQPRAAEVPETPDHRIAAVSDTSPVASAPLAGPAIEETQEVIVIVRDRGNPASSRVLTLHQPSAEMMQMIQRQAR